MTDWTPPPPGDTREQLPDDVLALIELPDYTSTACETALLLAGEATARPGRATELQDWVARLHACCRLSNKFTGRACRCDCHAGEASNV